MGQYSVFGFQFPVLCGDSGCWMPACCVLREKLNTGYRLPACRKGDEPLLRFGGKALFCAPERELHLFRMERLLG